MRYARARGSLCVLSDLLNFAYRAKIERMTPSLSQNERLVMCYLIAENGQVQQSFTECGAKLFIVD